MVPPPRPAEGAEEHGGEPESWRAPAAPPGDQRRLVRGGTLRGPAGSADRRVDVRATDPDTNRVFEAPESCPLVISQELFLSETARHADVVLPAASWLEKEGTFVNFDRRFRPRSATRHPSGTTATGQGACWRREFAAPNQAARLRPATTSVG
ncbi:molybdopterin-dependent oxidoreductase [Nonomuraea angiospora]|uniref:molybdopterin-dependent oxidoreductase n=1 Tax=Nonomuraea angiospora TaxID=46172 RepID=UPI003F56BAF1